MTDDDDDVSWPRALLRGAADVLALLFGLAGVLAIVVLAAAAMGTL